MPSISYWGRGRKAHSENSSSGWGNNHKTLNFYTGSCELEVKNAFSDKKIIIILHVIGSPNHNNFLIPGENTPYCSNLLKPYNPQEEDTLNLPVNHSFPHLIVQVTELLHQILWDPLAIVGLVVGHTILGIEANAAHTPLLLCGVLQKPIVLSQVVDGVPICPMDPGCSKFQSGFTCKEREIRHLEKTCYFLFQECYGWSNKKDAIMRRHEKKLSYRAECFALCLRYGLRLLARDIGEAVLQKGFWWRQGRPSPRQLLLFAVVDCLCKDTTKRIISAVWRYFTTLHAVQTLLLGNLGKGEMGRSY